jgi:ATP-dependent DNA ligase
LHEIKHDGYRLIVQREGQRVRLLAFDLLAVDGADNRREPLYARKARLTKLLTRSGDGIQLVEHLDGRFDARSKRANADPETSDQLHYPEANRGRRPIP